MTEIISILAFFNKYTFHVYFHMQRNETDFWGYTNVFSWVKADYLLKMGSQFKSK